MRNRKLWLILTLAAVLAVAGMIFFFSSQMGEDSGALSDGIVLPVLRALHPGFDDLSPAEQARLMAPVSLAIRKLAHFTEFALLGFFLMVHLRLRRAEGPVRRLALLAFGAAALYACSDEIHQIFVADRGPALLDVGIDAAGALCGVLAAAAAAARRRRAACGNGKDMGAISKQ